MHRIMPRLVWGGLIAKWNISLDILVQYIYGAARFVSDKVKKANIDGDGICPFQFDVLIAIGECIQMETDSMDETKHRPRPHRDYVGDIQQKLEVNKLRFLKKECKERIDRIFANLYQEFERKFKIDFRYLQHKRLCAVVDMRPPASVYQENWDKLEADRVKLKEEMWRLKESGKWNKMRERDQAKYERPKPREVPDLNAVDTVYLYDPPEVARHIPRNAVPERYTGLSRLCVLPDLEFTKREEEEKTDNDDADRREVERARLKKKYKHKNDKEIERMMQSMCTLKCH